jgi:hypothetical protein
VVVLVGTAPKQKLESWGDFEGLAEQHSRLSAEAQHRKLILAETLPTDFGGPGRRTRNRTGLQPIGPDRGDDRSKRHSDAGALHRRRSEFKGKRRHRISKGRCSLEPAQTQLAYHRSFGVLIYPEVLIVSGPTLYCSPVPVSIDMVCDTVLARTNRRTTSFLACGPTQAEPTKLSIQASGQKSGFALASAVCSKNVLRSLVR